MAKMFGIFACFVIIALDVVAGILGIKAEAAQNQEKHLRLFIFECKQPSHDAYMMGLAAIILLGMAHVLANLLGGCSICATDDLQKPSSNRLLSITSLILAWLVLAVGMGLLVIGTISNNKSRASCGFTHHHFFSIGGILCFVHGLISVAYYVTSTELNP
ncbi:OLC1v1025080C3 [Oldenlandia corymbosa var. corymbosa]|nr:OLC1v1025080C3 [Oldenlandia corymbosa var. corymbosa]